MHLHFLNGIHLEFDVKKGSWCEEISIATTICVGLEAKFAQHIQLPSKARRACTDFILFLTQSYHLSHSVYLFFSERDL